MGHMTLLGAGKPAAGGAAPFAITDLTNISAAWDAAILTSLYEERTGGGSTQSSVNGVVGTIRDLSGNGYHLVAPSDAARGILRQSGAIYYIEFDGSDDSYNTGSISFGSNAVVGGAWRKRSTWPDYAGVFGIDGGGYTASGTMILGKNTTADQVGWWLDTGHNLGTSVVTDTDYVEDIVKTGSAWSWLRNSDSERTYSGTDRSISGVFYAGIPTVETNMFWYGSHVATTYETGERTLARQYWAARCGVTL